MCECRSTKLDESSIVALCRRSTPQNRGSSEVPWDMAYKPFRPFSEWRQVQPRAKAWRVFEYLLSITRNVAPEDPRRALEAIVRPAASDRASRSVAYGETAPSQRDRLMASIIAGYSCALDLATSRAPVSEPWIRQLHATVCDGQEVQAGVTAAGDRTGQLYAFRKGEYKICQNNVWIPGKRRRFFSTPLDAPLEMQRFVAELNSDAFADAHPALQSAFAHYAFVAVHPFQDGNGRTARVLASIYTLRSHAVPLVTVFDRGYVAALQRADAGEYAPFVDFVVQRCSDVPRARCASGLLAALV